MLCEFVHVQSQSHRQSVVEYEKQLSKAVESNFNEKDWSFNSASREWSNPKLQLTLKSVYNQQMQMYTSPLQKLIEYNKAIFLYGGLSEKNEEDIAMV